MIEHSFKSLIYFMAVSFMSTNESIVTSSFQLAYNSKPALLFEQVLNVYLSLYELCTNENSVLEDIKLYKQF